MCMSTRRCTRLVNAFSKKFDNHVQALFLYFASYNACRSHKTLRMSPAMAAGVTDRLWSLGNAIARTDAETRLSLSVAFQELGKVMLPCRVQSHLERRLDRPLTNDELVTMKLAELCAPWRGKHKVAKAMFHAVLTYAAEN